MGNDVPPRRALSTKVRSGLTRQRAAVEKSRREVLEAGSKYLKPLGLARHKVVVFTAWVIAAAAAAFLISVSSLIYIAHSDSGFVYSVSRILPFPVARVNGGFVSYADYIFEVRYRKNLYANPSGPASATNQPINFSDPSAKDLLHQIQQDALNQAKLEAITKQVAHANRLGVSASELDQAVNNLVQSNGGLDQFKAAIKQYYNWSLADFQRVYYIQLLQQKLATAVLPGVSHSQQTQAAGILAKAKDGADFAQLAEKYSQDAGSRAGGGDLGFITANSPFVEQFKQAALALNPGQISDVIVTQFGFHIIKATDKKGDQVKVSHILIKFSEDINAYLNDQLAKAHVTNFVHLPAAPAAPNTKPTNAKTAN